MGVDDVGMEKIEYPRRRYDIIVGQRVKYSIFARKYRDMKAV